MIRTSTSKVNVMPKTRYEMKMYKVLSHQVCGSLPTVQMTNQHGLQSAEITNCFTKRKLTFLQHYVHITIDYTITNLLNTALRKSLTSNGYLPHNVHKTTTVETTCEICQLLCQIVLNMEQIQ